MGTKKRRGGKKDKGKRIRVESNPKPLIPKLTAQKKGRVRTGKKGENKKSKKKVFGIDSNRGQREEEEAIES